MNDVTTLTNDEIRQVILSKKPIPGKDSWPEANLDINKKEFSGDITKGIDFPLMDFARQVSANKMFPVSSTSLVMIGVLGTLTCRNISVKFKKGNDGSRPVTAYVIVGAESSAGKTPTLETFQEDLERISLIHERQKEKKRLYVEMKIADTFEEMKMVKKANPNTNMSSVPAYVELKDTLNQLHDDIKKYQPVTWNLPEYNLQKIAGDALEQNGYIPVRSDENEALLFLTGSKAGIETSIMRKGFDGSSFGYGKQNMSINIPAVYSGFCLCGQTDIFDLLIRESYKGNEVSNGFLERCMPLIEESLAGKKYLQKFADKPDHELLMRWRHVIKNVFDSCGDIDPDTGAIVRTMLDMTEESKDLIYHTYIEFDKLRGAGQVFSNRYMTGYVGKCSDHIANIASLFHILKKWDCDFHQEKTNFIKEGQKNKTGEERYDMRKAILPTLIDHETVEQAVLFYKRIVSVVKVMFESRGLMGNFGRVEKITDIIVSLSAKKRKFVLTNSEIQQAASGLTYFRNGAKLSSSELFDEIYPALESRNIVCVVGKKIYINPKLG